MGQLSGGSCRPRRTAHPADPRTPAHSGVNAAGHARVPGLPAGDPTSPAAASAGETSRRLPHEQATPFSTGEENGGVPL